MTAIFAGIEPKYSPQANTSRGAKLGNFINISQSVTVLLTYIANTKGPSGSKKINRHCININIILTH